MSYHFAYNTQHNTADKTARNTAQPAYDDNDDGDEGLIHAHGWIEGNPHAYKHAGNSGH